MNPPERPAVAFIAYYILLLLTAVIPATGDDCLRQWSPDFGPLGADGIVYCQAIFDDGSGPRLFIGGCFGSIDGAVMNGIAQWDGERWRRVGTPLQSACVYAMCVHDDGNGPQLYVGGQFTCPEAQTSNIARWDGTRWTSLGPPPNSRVLALASYDDGAGAALFCGGWFSTFGTTEARGIARWADSTWTSVQGMVANRTNAFAVFDDGLSERPALYAAARFGFAPLGTVQQGSVIARWDGNTWSSPTSPGLDLEVAFDVNAMTVHTDAQGPALWATGQGLRPPGSRVPSALARWDAKGWTFYPQLQMSESNALISFTPAGRAAPDLYVAGRMESPSLPFNDRIIGRFNGATLDVFDEPWQATSYGAATAFCVGSATLDDWTQPRLIIGGNFGHEERTNLRHIASQDELTPEPFVADRTPHGLTWPVYRQLAFGGHLFVVSGSNASAGDLDRWNGLEWDELEEAPADAFGSLALHADPGQVEAIYAVGRQVHQTFITRFDGSAWSVLPGTFTGTPTSLISLNTPAGRHLFLAGNSLFGGGAAISGIARWDGAQWNALGNNLAGEIREVVGFGEGKDFRVIAVGSMRTGSSFFNDRGVASWDGSAWTKIDPPTFDPQTEYIYTATIFDDGTGPAMYIGGNFLLTLDSQTVTGIARWNGTQWLPAGGVFQGVPFKLTVINDGATDRLCATGDFGVRVWTGTSWISPPYQINGHVSSIGSLIEQPGDPPAIYVGGTGTAAWGSLVVRGMARWGCAHPPRPACPGDANADYIANGIDLTVLLSRFGDEVQPGSPGDFDSNGIVSGSDLAVLLARFGQTCTP